MTTWTRLKNDINGNSRWLIHWLDLEPVADRTLDLHTRHARVLNAARAVGGKMYRSKDYGGGIVFQAYEHQLPMLAERIRASLREQTA